MNFASAQRLQHPEFASPPGNAQEERMAGEQGSLVRHSSLDEMYVTYEIRVKGRLNADHWAEWFEGMAITD